MANRGRSIGFSFSEAVIHLTVKEKSHGPAEPRVNRFNAAPGLARVAVDVRMMVGRAVMLVLAAHEFAVAAVALLAAATGLGGLCGHGERGGDKRENEKRPEHPRLPKAPSQWPKVRQKMKAVMAALRQEMTMRASAGSILRA